MGEYDCDQCNEGRQLVLGCKSADTALMESLTVNGERIWRCPKALFKEMDDPDIRFISRILFYYANWERGHLPKSGGVDDQDQFIMQCFPVVSKWVNYNIHTRGK